MKKKIIRSVSAGVLSFALLIGSCGCANNSQNLQKSLVENLSADCDLNFKEVPYFSCENFGITYSVNILGHCKVNMFSSEEEQFREFTKVKYNISREDYLSLKEKTGSFEAIIPFNDEVIEELINITNNYDPAEISMARLNKNGTEIINELVK